ncbi:PAS domain S-box protein [Bacillus sp. FJAT-49736]|uniref:PAS domain S-box protein n=1 Tax=Bacillus sp. FJAT-49736 TaxID=2833582 RepID=UPI001BCA1634|nr:PAS domain S-box protein [Bacillus sp. FJAT-49736]MBS4174143.1 PAS domain S-box protein [Bacillus sp. FJAT-49736]
MNDVKKIFDLFLHIFNSMSDMLFITQIENNDDYRYLFINEAASSFTGLTSDVYGKTMNEVLPSPMYSFIKEKYDEAIKKKSPLQYVEKFEIPSEKEAIIGTNGKRLIYYETTITPVFDSSNASTHILAIVRDITLQKQKEKELKMATDHFKLLFNSTADAIFTFDAQENFTSANLAFEKLFGWKQEEILENPSISIIPDMGKKELKNMIIHALKTGQTIPSHEVQRLTKDGQIIDVLASYSPLCDHDGNWDGGVAVYKDITELKQIFNELKESEEKYRLITEHTSDLIKIIDPEGIVLYSSPSHFETLGIRPEDTLNKPIFIGMHPESKVVLKNTIQKILHTAEPASFIYQRQNQNGEYLWMHTIASPIMNEKNEVDRILFIARNITESKKYEEKLKNDALSDFLTGQPNRRHFFHKLTEEMDKAFHSQTTMALLLLDIDRFKWINDTMGHDTGDQLLKSFSARVRHCLRDDDILARLGGDEFAILLPNIQDQQDVIKIANRIIKSLQKNWKIEDHIFKTTSSIGIAFYPPYHQHHKELLKHADMALYAAKEKGRNNFQIYSHM